MRGAMSSSETTPQFSTIPATWPIPTTPTTVDGTNLRGDSSLGIGDDANWREYAKYKFLSLTKTAEGENERIFNINNDDKN